MAQIRGNGKDDLIPFWGQVDGKLLERVALYAGMAADREMEGGATAVSLSLSLSLSRSLALSLPLSLARSISLSLTHTNTRSLALSLSLGRRDAGQPNDPNHTCSHEPSEWDQIVFFNCLELYHNSPNSGERQYTSRT